MCINAILCDLLWLSDKRQGICVFFCFHHVRQLSLSLSLLLFLSMSLAISCSLSVCVSLSLLLWSSISYFINNNNFLKLQTDSGMFTSIV